jgi:hypothetical protein
MADEEFVISETAAFDAEVRLINHLKYSTTGNPFCGRAGCLHGVLGIASKTGIDGKPHLALIPCKCAQHGKSEYALLNQRFTDLVNHIANVFIALEQADNQRMEKAIKEISAQIAAHHETLSRQIEETQDIILRHSILWLARKAGEELAEKWEIVKGRWKKAKEEREVDGNDTEIKSDI